ncbi:discoidin, CUB and LCCL domain-containing protein 1-like isoform X1 [Polyodon spathula]|uniref:discoidin, CUB and LCCL domain-containing protein 1-like isoform X1 n=1 Tax=Polyodon spathula TaxID=7913 RepID=UPI001B7F31A9|nr:discoidin, CUB and LCCL domain-containing protein 1-like isoform X1 [Polyodon spathula]
MSGRSQLYGFLSFFIGLSAPLLSSAEKLGDGCGHSVLGQESGVLTSKNYPGTYPNHTWCKWKIQVPEGKTIILKFGDLDIEAQHCESDYVKVFKGTQTFGNAFVIYCGNLKSYTKEILVDTNEITVQFESGHHLSGRGFLLSYATSNHKDLLTCLDKASHFPESKYSKYCPAGCKAIAGDVSGDNSEGYRHTSVLCKAAIHAGVILDELGGQISVIQDKGLGRYEGIKANGIQTKEGSLSDKRIVFSTNDCSKPLILDSGAITATSAWQQTNENGQVTEWSAENGRLDVQGSAWAADHNNTHQWMLIDLGEKKNITGIITSGSTLPSFNFYVQSYTIKHSKDGQKWRMYRQAGGTEEKIFEGNLDYWHQTRNNFLPSIVARHICIIPQTWHQRIAMKVALIGCPQQKANASEVPIPQNTSPDTNPHAEDDDITETFLSQTDLVKLAIFVVLAILSLVLLFVGVCVYKTFRKKRTKENAYGLSDAPKAGCWKQIKQPFAKHQSTEFTISYSPEKEMLNKLDVVKSNMADYQQPLMIGTGTVTRKGSTFRPIDTDTKEEIGRQDPATHYDYLQTANQYALPLTNQEPEYATPIIERHNFRKDAYTPDMGYNVPAVGLSKKPSFNASDCNGYNKQESLTGDYQTPQVITESTLNEEAGYDRPKLSIALATATAGTDYQKPQVTLPVTEGYSAPRDCLKPASPRQQ